MTKHRKLITSIISIVLAVGVVLGGWYQHGQNLSASAVFGVQQYRKGIFGSGTSQTFYYNQELKVVQKEVKQKFDRHEYIDTTGKKIYFSDGQLKYEIDGQEVSTETIGDQTYEGYVHAVYDDQTHIIGVEILNTRITDDKYDGALSRIVNLVTKEHVVVEGLLFNTCILRTGFLYCRTFDNLKVGYTSAIDLTTMKETRHHLPPEVHVSLLYEYNNEVYVQSSMHMGIPYTYKLTKGLFEQVGFYIPEITNILESTATPIYLDQHFPSVDGSHRYLYAGPDQVDPSKQISYLITTSANGILVTEVQLSDANNIGVKSGIYVDGKYYLQYDARVEPDDVSARLVEFDSTGKVIQNVDISDTIAPDWSILYFCQ